MARIFSIKDLVIKKGIMVSFIVVSSVLAVASVVCTYIDFERDRLSYDTCLLRLACIFVGWCLLVVLLACGLIFHIFEPF